MAGSTSAAIDPIRSAHDRLVADPSFQFSWAARPPVPPPPSWLEALFRLIGRGLEAAAPFIKIGLWALLALAALGVAIALLRQLLVPAARSKPLPAHSRSDLRAASRAAQTAIARLEEADRLASEGRYADAAHVLLLRGVADVEHSRAGAIQPSLTTREIAALPDLPSQPRAAFALIARTVEHALFGGAQIDAGRWNDCRRAYETLVRPEAWKIAPAEPRR